MPRFVAKFVSILILFLAFIGQLLLPLMSCSRCRCPNGCCCFTGTAAVVVVDVVVNDAAFAIVCSLEKS